MYCVVRGRHRILSTKHKYAPDAGPGIPTRATTGSADEIIWLKASNTLHKDVYRHCMRVSAPSTCHLPNSLAGAYISFYR